MLGENRARIDQTIPGTVSGNYLHIVCLDVPYPADYGGAMEEFYKLKALSELGVKLILHCFTYGDRKPQPELEKYAEQVYYYERQRKFSDLFSSLPFIVKSRMPQALLHNLKNDGHPILFDATHSSGFLSHPDLKNRKKYVRLHNIEWIYYNTLFRSAIGLKDKLYFYSEYKKLREYDACLVQADALFCLSQTDAAYYQEKFPQQNISLEYVFHENLEMNCKEGRGDYLLYHGNLSILDNYMAVIDLLNKDLKDCPYPIVLAGKAPDKLLYDTIRERPNIRIVANPSNEELDELIRNAQICLAIANNPSGIKLKLINSMYRGRFIFSNESAFVGSGLDTCVLNIDEHREALLALVEAYMQRSFAKEEIEKRAAILQENYDNRSNALRIRDIIFPPA